MLAKYDRLIRLGGDTSMSLADGTDTRKQTLGGEGAYVMHSPTRGVLVYITPGGWSLLMRILKWLLAAGGLYIYAGSS